MNAKKSYKAELENRKINFFLIGCIVALSLSWFCLDVFATEQEQTIVMQDEAEAAKVEEYIPPETDQQEQPPQQQEEIQQQNEEIILDMVDNSKKVEFDASDLFGLDADADLAIEDFTPVEVIEETEEVAPPLLFANKMPAFPGGPQALQEYLKKETQYPPAAREARAQGKVMVQFVVEKDGSVSDIRVLASVFPALDQEAIRVCKGMPKWEPGENNGKKVRVFYTMPFEFSLQ